MDVRDDILNFVRPEDGLTESVNAGQSRHEGVEVGLWMALPGGIVADASVTRASHQYREWRPRATVDYSGNQLEQAPRTLGSARLRLPLPALSAALSAADAGQARRGFAELEGVHMGDFWMNPENTEAYEGHTLWNLRIELPLSAHVSLFARAMNLTDRTYAERASFNAFRGAELSPGKPRTFFVGLRWGMTP
jgi:iron complex outermembrane recepter protein